MSLAGPTLLTADPDTGNVSAYSTPSVSPAAGSLVCIDVLSTHGSAAAEPTITVGFAITGSIQEIAKAQHASAQRYVKSVYCIASGTPGSGVVTATFGGNQTGCIIIVTQYTGQHATTPILQGTTDVVAGAGFTSKTATLPGALAASTSIMHAAIGHGSNEDQTASLGGTELSGSDVGYATPAARLGIYSALNDTEIGATWTTGQNAWAIFYEVVEDVGGGTALTLDLSDSVPLSDAPSLQRDLALAPTDTVPLADDAQLARDMPLTLSDSVPLSDSAQVEKGVELSLSDTVPLSDSAQLQRDLGLAPTDAVPLSDSAQLVRDLALSLVDTAPLADATGLSAGIGLSFADTVPVSDGFTGEIEIPCESDAVCGTFLCGEATCGTWWACPQPAGLWLGGQDPDEIFVGQPPVPAAGLALGTQAPGLVIGSELDPPEAGLRLGAAVPAIVITTTLSPAAAGLGLGAYAPEAIGRSYLQELVCIDMPLVEQPESDLVLVAAGSVSIALEEQECF